MGVLASGTSTVHTHPLFTSSWSISNNGTVVSASANLLANGGAGSFYGYRLRLQVRFFNGNRLIKTLDLLSVGSYSSVGTSTKSFDAAGCTHCQLYMTCSSPFCDIAGRNNASGWAFGTKVTFAWAPKNVSLSNASAYEDNTSISSYSSSLKIKWTVPSTSPQATKVAYAYKKASAADWIVVEGANTTNTFSKRRDGIITLTNLDSNTRYTVALMAGNDSGWSSAKISEGATITIKTRQKTPVITKLTAVPDSHQIKVTWTADTVLQRLLYTATANEVGDVKLNTVNISPAASSGSFTITDLIPGQRYDIGINGSSSPDGVVSSKKHVYARCKSPTLIVTCAKKANTTNTFVITWNSNMSLKTIKDTIKKSNGSIFRNTTNHSVSGTKGTYEITLSSGEKYSIEFQGVETPKNVNTNTVTKTVSTGELPSINKIYNQSDKATFVFGEPNANPSITVSITGGTGYTNTIGVYLNNKLLASKNCSADSAVTIPLSQDNLDAIYKTYPRTSNSTEVDIKLTAKAESSTVKTETRSKTCVLRGNAKVVTVGTTSGVPKRAKIWVGTTSGVPKRAVCFAGVSSGVPKRTI